jgi:hypothetical protein
MLYEKRDCNEVCVHSPFAQRPKIITETLVEFAFKNNISLRSVRVYRFVSYLSEKGVPTLEEPMDECCYNSFKHHTNYKNTLC